jgi:ABC-type nitrate/sulfonate/bicarbonate transport system substrate-binding protein
MKTLRTAAMAAALVSLAAFGGKAQAAGTIEHTSVSLPATTVTFLPVYVAKDLGMWKKLGLDVTVHNITGMGTTNAMLAGSVDFAVQSGASLIRGNIRGRHMTGIALMAEGVDFAIVGSPSLLKGLPANASVKERIARLKGKKVSVDAPNTVVDIVLRYFAGKDDLNAKSDMTEVYMQPTEAIAALKSGAIQAAVLNYPWVETALRMGNVMVASGATDVPELIPTIATTTTTRQGFCDSHQSICEKLARGYVEAHKFIHEHPQQALEVAMKRMPGANKQDLENSLKELVNTTPLVPRYKEANFLHVQQFMIFGGILKKDEARKNFDNMFTNKYVDMAAKVSS